ncbi:MAG: hypothetical protein HXY43_21625 [Fischerella sp.]|jgi:hypothetical protein|uniref:hypothetical protein n=1 Tax=Fischerella sp. TaxID=1191 RepID=UPI00180F2EAF|nr:hypothetical protein [Fischerella sp.]NWF61784.1 hypothetical protein [Fischerella sp.]
MSTSADSKNEAYMIDIKYIAAIKWDEELADKLKNLRGKISRQALADKTKELNEQYPDKYLKITWQYIQQLETPKYEMKRRKSKGYSETIEVSLDVLTTLCYALGCDVMDLFMSKAYVALAGRLS